MNKEFEIFQQEVVEMAEQYCGGFVRDYKHALEKLRESFLSRNLSSQAHSQKLLTSNSSRTSTLHQKGRVSLANISNDELQAEIKRCRQIILSQHERISAIPQLETELKDYEKRLAQEISKLNNKYQNEISQYKKEMNQYHKIVAINSQNEEKIKLLNMEIESFRRHFHKEIDSDGRVAQLQEFASSRSKEIQKLEINANRLKIKVSLKSQEVQKLTNRILILEKELEEIKKTKSDNSSEKQDFGDSNAALVKHYKRKLDDREIEVKKLNKRVCKMQRIEIQCKLKEEGFANERKDYIDRIADLCKANVNMEKMLSNSTIKLTGKEISKKNEPIAQANYQNVMELARSATDAYHLLVSREKSISRSTRPTTAGADSKWSGRVNSAKKLKICT